MTPASAAEAIARLAAKSSTNLQFRQGSVVSIQTGPPLTITVSVGGDSANPIAKIVPLSSYGPSVNDVCYLLLVDDVHWLAIGKPHD